MKKLALCILSFMMFGSSFMVNILAMGNEKLFVNAEAVNVMEEFIYTNSQVDDMWNEMSIRDVDELYDGNLNFYGYVFDLAREGTIGYGIVVDSGVGYVVAEASPDEQSPYHQYSGFRKIYTTALNYYVQNTFTRSNQVIKVDDNTLLNLDDLQVKRMSFSTTASTRNVSSTYATTTRYLGNYSANFEFVTQKPNTKACIPASFAMALIYWENAGKIQIAFDGTNAEMKESLYNYMKNTGGSVAVSAGTAEIGIESWTLAYCSDFYVTIEIDNFYPTASEFSNLTAQINNNNPTVVMFYDGVVVSGANHATCMVGYRSSDTGSNYVIVSDPWETSANTKYIIWNTSNVYGYFIMEKNSF